QTMTRAVSWHPDGYSLLLLQGEAAFELGRPAEAAEALWEAFHQTPQPRYSAAQLWRMAMLAGPKAWGSKDRRVAAAAAQVLRLAPEDPLLPPAEKENAMREAREALAATGTLFSGKPTEKSKDKQ